MTEHTAQDTPHPEIELEIERLGARGDGIAKITDGASSDEPIYVPFALPGERVRVSRNGNRARLLEVLTPSPDRQTPVCPHFTVCGGCVAQHMGHGTYLEWKCSNITAALSARGIEAILEPVFSIGEGTRRRAVVTARMETPTQAAASDASATVCIGFHREGSHDLVDIKQCPVLTPKIVDLLPKLREVLAPMLAHTTELRITILDADNGLDVDIAGRNKDIPRQHKANLATSATTLGATSLSLNGDPLFQAEKPVIRCGNVLVSPPSGVFVQASQRAEQKMTELILEALPKRSKRVADLFCGVGTFSFPLASRVRVTSIDSDPRAIDALETAQRHAQGIKRIETLVRDLFNEPLSRRELNEFDAVVYDPPRAGAKTQAENIAKSKVPCVVAVSCNPASFARDARTLIDGGYTIQNITPIDQFVYAAHVELVAVFRRN